MILYTFLGLRQCMNKLRVLCTTDNSHACYGVVRGGKRRQLVWPSSVSAALDCLRA
jgi:hypothetical protein